MPIKFAAWTKPVLRLGLYYAAFGLILFGVHLIYDNFRPLQIFRIGNLALSDFELNDLYYRLSADEDLNMAEKNIVLINAGSFKDHEFRSKMADLLHRLKNYNPSCTGVDIRFEGHTRPGSIELRAALRDAGENLCVAYPSDTFFLPEDRQASVLLPSTHAQTIRYYFGRGEVPTLAEKLSVCYDPDADFSQLPDSFLLHYTCTHDGFYNVQESFGEQLINFPAIEADSVLADSSMKFRELIQDKIVIIGWLGRGIMKSNDAEDHFKTPSDTNNLVARIPLMPGAVIHATAVENLIGEDSIRFREAPVWLIALIKQALLLLFLSIVLFRNPPKWLKLSLLAVLSVPYVLFILKLMDWGFYFPAGSTLIELLIIEETIGFVKKPLEYLWKSIEKRIS